MLKFIEIIFIIVFEKKIISKKKNMFYIFIGTYTRPASARTHAHTHAYMGTSVYGNTNELVHLHF